MIEKIKNEKLPVIIFGAGIVGEVLYRACQDIGIKVECFCDNNINKTKRELCGIPVIYTPRLKKKYEDASFLLSAADIKDAVGQLERLGYSKWHSCNALLRNCDIQRRQFNMPADFVEYAVATAMLCHDSYLTPDKLFLRSVDLIITERCSLRCKDCSNLMQYYKAPKDCSTGELMSTVDRFCSIMDEVNEFRVLGGEPFMNKEAGLIIERLTKENKVKKVVIYTNGAIVPKQIEYFKNDKVLFIITDYGRLSRNLDNLVKVLGQEKISYYVQKARGWTDCGKIMKHNRNLEQKIKLFGDCCAKNTITLSDGKLYRCPFSANASRLKAVPNSRDDYINLFENVKIDEMKKRIRAYILEKDFLEACDFCNGRSFSDPEIEPAVQISKPIEYQKYE